MFTAELFTSEVFTVILDQRIITIHCLINVCLLYSTQNDGSQTVINYILNMLDCLTGRETRQPFEESLILDMGSYIIRPISYDSRNTA